MALFDLLRRHLLLPLSMCAWVMAGDAANAQPLRTDHVVAELVAERSAVRPGESLQIALRLQHLPHWHTYWRNPGDSGLPTTLSWRVPTGAGVGEIEWPAPVRLPIGPLVNYGYEGDLLLPLRFTAPAQAKPGTTLMLRAQAAWLVCKDVCIPEDGALEMELPVVDASTQPGATAYTARFASAAEQVPTQLTGWRAEMQQAGRSLLLTVTRSGPPDSSEATSRQGASSPSIDVFPYASQVIEPARQDVFRTPRGFAVQLELLDNATPPTPFTGLLVARGGTSPWSSQHRAVEFAAPVTQVAVIALPAGAVKLADLPGGAATGAIESPSSFVGGADLGLLTALTLALIGGVVLNLMPCVLPVLSIKLLSLVEKGGSKPALRRHALFYSGGVLLTFLALATVVLLLRSAGNAVGWGFQLQEPGVVFALAMLFFALGLNLLGAFDFGNLAPGPLLALRAREPAIDAFASGVIAVLAASPCTAPFMGAALGFAMTQPFAVGLAVFAMLGLGMALPYAALAVLPGWRSRLPQPGAWMLRLKQGLAFPLFATVVWLIWVLGLQAGVDGAAKALLALVAAAFGFWCNGVLAGLRTSATVRRFGGAAIVLAVFAVLAWSWPLGKDLSSDGQVASSARTPGGGGPAAVWQPYDESELTRQVSAGKPVFVDFTAAWCVSCQVNKRLVLHREKTLAAFADANVLLMQADWTRRDPRITAALSRLGRNGVPVYVLMRPGKAPLLLPEILTARLLSEALATL